MDIEEFGNLLEQLNISVQDDVAMEAFAALDVDGSGKVSTSEFVRMLDSSIEQVLPAVPPPPLAEAPSTKERFVSLVAHNEMKPAMMAFANKHFAFFSKRRILTTGSTGRALEEKLGLTIAHKVASGPLGGDQDIGGMISRGEVAAVFFFRDPLSAHPHDADIIALSRLCDVHNVLTANNPASAGALLSALRNVPEYSSMLQPLTREKDSSVVKAYKARQSKVISAVSGQDSGQAEQAAGVPVGSATNVVRSKN